MFSANVLEYISPKKKGPFIEEQRAMRSRNESGLSGFLTIMAPIIINGPIPKSF